MEMYTARELRYVEIAGTEAYEKAVLKTDSGLSNPVLLRLLFRGPRLNLYAHGTDSFFLREKGGDLVRLDVIPPSDGRNFSSDVYKNVLDLYAAKYGLSDLSARIERMTYSQSDLLRTVQLLNGSQGRRYTAPVFKNRLHWFLGAGVGVSGLNISGDNLYFNQIKFKNTTIPYFVAGFDYYLSKGIGPLALRAELSYFSATYKASGVATSTSQDHLTYTFQQRNISPAVYVLYHFINLQRLKVYAAAGIGANFSSYSNNTFQESYPVAATTGNYTNFSSPWVSGNFKLGAIVSKRVEIGVAGIFGDFTRESNYRFDPHTYFCWLAYRLK